MDVKGPWRIPPEVAAGSAISNEQSLQGTLQLLKALWVRFDKVTGADFSAEDVFISWAEMEEASKLRFRAAPDDEGVTISIVDGDPPAQPVWGERP